MNNLRILLVILVASVSACREESVAKSADAAAAGRGSTAFSASFPASFAAPSNVPAASGDVILPIQPSAEAVTFSVACDSSRMIQSDSQALLVRDPAVLAGERSLNALTQDCANGLASRVYAANNGDAHRQS